MTWPLFAVIQLALFTLGTTAAFWLRNRQLKAQIQVLEAQSREAEQTLADAAERFDGMAEAAVDAWLDEKITACSLSDPVGQLQRLVLENARAPDPAFPEDVKQLLATDEATDEADAAEWRALREASHQIACQLIERHPYSAPAVRQLYDAFSVLDETFCVTLPPLPDAQPADHDDPTDLGQEAEHLRAANELLVQQLDAARADLAQRQEMGVEADEQAEDLKKLLQQFTQDSRDMLVCIQNLEQENAQLKSLLDANDGAPAGPDAKEPSHQENHAA